MRVELSLVFIEEGSRLCEKLFQDHVQVEAMNEEDGLQRNVLLTVPIGVDEVAGDILEVVTPLQRGDKITVELMLQGEKLPDLEFAPDCVN